MSAGASPQTLAGLRGPTAKGGEGRGGKGRGRKGSGGKGGKESAPLDLNPGDATAHAPPLSKSGIVITGLSSSNGFRRDSCISDHGPTIRVR